MAPTIQREPGGVFRLDITGLLRKAELDDAQAQLLREMRDHGDGAARLLVVLHAFEGWEPGANWSDLGFYVRHGDALARIAIVGDERWRDHALMFAAADLRKGPVEYFESNRLDDARRWLSL